MAVGLAVTVVLDVVLIPPFGAVGAAIASAVAYATSALALVAFFRWLNRPERALEPRPEGIKAASAGTP
jgi:Na+-driven multidrug efflux pump